MGKIKPISDQDDKHHGWVIFCPGCKQEHVFDNRWTLSGDATQPTFVPSLLVNEKLSQMQNLDGSKKYPWALRCHSHVTKGQIQFLPDCDHDLKGQTLDLPEIT